MNLKRKISKVSRSNDDEGTNKKKLRKTENRPLGVQYDIIKNEPKVAQTKNSQSIIDVEVKGKTTKEVEGETEISWGRNDSYHKMKSLMQVNSSNEVDKGETEISWGRNDSDLKMKSPIEVDKGEAEISWGRNDSDQKIKSPMKVNSQTKPKKNIREYKKRSIVHYFFEWTNHPETKKPHKRCLLSPFTSNPNHYEYLTEKLTVSNALSHLRECHEKELAIMERARNEGFNLDIAWKNLLATQKLPTTPLEKFLMKTGRVTTTHNDGVKVSLLTTQKLPTTPLEKILIKTGRVSTTHNDGVKVSGKFAKEIALVVWSTHSQITFNAFNSQHSKDLVKDALETLYVIALKDGEETIKNCQSFATTMDMWTTLSGDHYLILTYHAISLPDWQFHHRILDVIPYPGPGFNKTISTAVNVRIQQHTLPNNLHCASIQDQETNITCAGETMTNDDGNHCFSNILHHVVLDTFGGKDGKRTLGSAVEASKDLILMSSIIMVINTHGILKQHLIDLQEDIEGKSAQLVEECVIRWEGLDLSVSRFLRLQGPIMKLLETNPPWYISLLKDLGLSLVSDPISDAFWKRLNSYKDLLNLLNEISKSSQAENSPSASNIPYWIHELVKGCDVQATDTSIILETKQALLKNIQSHLITKYLKKVSNPLKAALLDPRYSAKVQNYGVSQELIDASWKSILKEAADLSLNNISGELYKIKKGIYKATLPLLQLKLQNANVSIESDPLQWWKNDDITLFHPVAAMFLQIPASASERGFSSLGGFVTKNRSLLSTTHVEQLTVIRDYVTQKKYSFDSVMCLVQNELDNIMKK